jgi:hypothetical protein
VVVRDFDFVGMAAPRIKTDSVPIINSDAVLSAAISAKSLQTVAGRHLQFLQIANAIQLVQLPPRGGPQIARARLPSGPRVGPVEILLRPLIAKGGYHALYYTL